MNNVTLIGRITKDPEIRYSQSAEPVAFGNYTLAIDRPKRRDAEAVTDFIYCRVVGRPAEFAEKYLRKGMKIAVQGRIQVDNYKDKDGNNRSTTYVQVHEHEFCESKQEAQKPADNIPVLRPNSPEGFMSIPDGIEEELPYM